LLSIDEEEYVIISTFTLLNDNTVEMMKASICKSSHTMHCLMC
jgi:hypothetical protein